MEGPWVPESPSGRELSNPNWIVMWEINFCLIKIVCCCHSSEFYSHQLTNIRVRNVYIQKMYQIGKAISKKKKEVREIQKENQK